MRHWNKLMPGFLAPAAPRNVSNYYWQVFLIHKQIPAGQAETILGFLLLVVEVEVVEVC